MTLGRHDFLFVAGAPLPSLRLSRWTRANSGALALPEQSRASLAGARSALAILGNGLCRSPRLGALRKNSLAGRHMNFFALWGWADADAINKGRKSAQFQCWKTPCFKK